MHRAAENEGLRAELTSLHSNTQLDSKQIALLTDKLHVLRDELTASIARSQVRCRVCCAMGNSDRRLHFSRVFRLYVPCSLLSLMRSVASDAAALPFPGPFRCSVHSHLGLMFDVPALPRVPH